MPPEVSVLITVFNREHFLAETLQSVLDSSYENFEVIVVDDCSTDQSWEVSASFVAADSRVRAIRNERNLGDYGNRAKAASLATGEYLKYVDSDDLIYPHTLAVMVRAMDEHPDAAVGLAHSIPEDEEPYPWRLKPDESYRKHFLGRGCLSCGPTGAIIRRDAFETAGGFRKEWGVLSDTELWLRLAAQHPVVLLPPGLVWWRRHEGQEFTKDDAMEVYLQRGHELVLQALSDNKCPLSETERKVIVALRKQHYARRLISLATRQCRPILAWSLLIKSGLTAAELLTGLRRYS